jgi:hypothetical protein
MKTMVMSGYLLQMPGDQAIMKPIRPAEIIAAVTWAIGAASC